MKHLSPALIGCLSLALITQAANACTGIYAFQNGRALAGNNEDYWNPNIKMWFVPAEEGSFGRVYFGFENLFPQGGMNDQGLFFDGFATKAVPVVGSRGKKPFSGNVMDEVMAKCSTVDEVLEQFQKYNLEFLERSMLFYADRFGNSVIIEGDDLVRKKGRYQVVTNFYQSQSPPEEYTCPRYKKADAMLGASEEISVELFRDVLNAVHAEGPSYTLYSNICDLTNGKIYLYHFHNYENVVVLDLAEELKKGKRIVDIPSLFPANPAWTTFEKARRDELQRRRDKLKLKEVDPEELEQYVGRYEIDLKGIVRSLDIAREGSSLFVLVMDQPKVEVLPTAPGRFFLLDFFGTTTFTFGRDEQGKVAELVVERGGGKYTAKRVSGK